MHLHCTWKTASISSDQKTDNYRFSCTLQIDLNTLFNFSIVFRCIFSMQAQICCKPWHRPGDSHTWKHVSETVFFCHSLSHTQTQTSTLDLHEKNVMRMDSKCVYTWLFFQQPYIKAFTDWCKGPICTFPALSPPCLAAAAFFPWQLVTQAPSFSVYPSVTVSYDNTSV